MASVLFPHLAIIDGTVGMEGMGPAYGRGKKMGMILVGNNALSTDAVAARLMGLSPEVIPHLRLTAERGWEKSTCKRFQSTQKITRNGWSLLSLPLPNYLFLSRTSWFMTRDRAVPAFQRCWSFFKITIQSLRTIVWRIKTFILAFGKHLEACPKGTILIGNCSSKMKSRGIFIQGCPPVASQIADSLKI